MPKSRLDIILTVKEEVSESVKVIRGELKAFEKDIKENQKALKELGLSLTAVGIGLGALLIKTGLTAARVEVLGTSLGVMARNAGIGANEMKGFEEGVKDLGISTSKAREILGGFITAELNLAQATDLARTAQNLAVFQNENSSVTAAKLTEAIGAQSVMMLRQYNITTTSTEIFEKYATMMGTTADKLTTVEKKQAFLNVILQEGTKYAGLYEEAMGDVGKQISSLSRLIETFEEEFGKEFLPIMRMAVETVSDLLKAYKELSPEVKKLITQMTIAAATFTLLLGPSLLLIGYLPAIKAGFLLLGTAIGPVIVLFAMLSAIIAMVVTHLEEAEFAVKYFLLAVEHGIIYLQILTDRITGNEEALRIHEEALKMNAEEANKLWDEFVKGEKSIRNLGDSFEGVIPKIEEFGDTIKEEVDNAISGLKKLQDRFWGMADEEISALQDVIDARQERMELIKADYEADLDLMSEHRAGLIKEYEKEEAEVSKAEERIRQIKAQRFISPVEEVIRRAGEVRVGIEERITGLGLVPPTRPPLFAPISPTPGEVIKNFNFNFEGAFIGNPEEFKKEVIDIINRESELKALGGQ